MIFNFDPLSTVSQNKKYESEHTWRLNDNEIDIFGLDEGYHNGPICVVCGYSFCHHCYDEVPVKTCSGRFNDYDDNS